jgi:hypothetical protein
MISAIAISVQCLCTVRLKSNHTAGSLVAIAPPIVLPDWNPNPGSTICGLGSSDIDKYVSPPKEVMDLIKISFGIGESLTTVSLPVIRQIFSD